jgi:hypothetical protein
LLFFFLNLNKLVPTFLAKNFPVPMARDGERKSLQGEGIEKGHNLFP